VSMPTTAQTTHYVDARGDCDGRTPCFSTINEGIGAAASGDTVAVFGGVYDESLTLNGAAGVTLRTHAEPFAELSCTADPRPKRAAFNGLTLEDGNDGFRVENMTFGGAEVYGSAHDVAFIGNRIGSFALTVCDLEIRHNVIHGRGINIIGAGFECVIADNRFDGADIEAHLFSTILGLEVRDNIFNGGSVHIENDVLRDSVFARNRMTGGSLTIGGRGADDNLIEGNGLSGGGGIVLVGTSGTDGNRIVGNDVRGSTGTGILVDIASETLPEFGTSGANEITGNTALDNAGCDIEDISHPDIDNTWSGNTFGTACGTADG
jgi:hypothetical protein